MTQGLGIEKKPSRIEVIARGACCMDGRLLLCRNRKAGNRYLPGGHIEPGESARQALEREILEELGMPSTAERFLGACEHVFTQNGRLTAELNLVFALSIPGFSPGIEPDSRESWIAFEWRELHQLEASGLEPSALCPCLPLWLAGVDSGERFCSFRRKRRA